MNLFLDIILVEKYFNTNDKRQRLIGGFLVCYTWRQVLAFPAVVLASGDICS